jgi:hypothetical protein
MVRGGIDEDRKRSTGGLFPNRVLERTEAVRTEVGHKKLSAGVFSSRVLEETEAAGTEVAQKPRGPRWDTKTLGRAFSSCVLETMEAAVTEEDTKPSTRHFRTACWIRRKTDEGVQRRVRLTEGRKTLKGAFSDCVPERTEAAGTDEDAKLSTGCFRTACWKTRKQQNPLGACWR